MEEQIWSALGGALVSLVFSIPALFKSVKEGRAKEDIIQVLKEGIENGVSGGEKGESWKQGTTKYMVRTAVNTQLKPLAKQLFKKLIH